MEEKERKLPYKILGVYKPTVLHPDNIGRDLLDMVSHAGPYRLNNYVEVRSAAWHSRYSENRVPYNHGGDADWHQDGTVEPWLIVWSTKSPTQVKAFNSQEIFQPAPYQVVLIDNRIAEHRRHGDMKGRWFARLLAS